MIISAITTSSRARVSISRESIFEGNQNLERPRLEFFGRSRFFDLVYPKFREPVRISLPT